MLRLLHCTRQWSSPSSWFRDSKALANQSNFAAGAEAHHAVEAQGFAVLEVFSKFVNMREWNLQNGQSTFKVVGEGVFVLNTSLGAFVRREEIHQANGFDVHAFAQGCNAGINVLSGREGRVHKDADPSSLPSQGLREPLRHVGAKASLFKRFHSLTTIPSKRVVATSGHGARRVGPPRG